MSPIEIMMRKNPNLDADDADFALLEVGELIKNYCNIDEIPKELSFTWANMALDVLNSLGIGGGSAGEPDFEDGISEFRLGDMTIKFGRGVQGFEDYKSNDFARYQAQLNKFRRLVW